MSDPPDVWRAGRDGVSVRFYLLLFIAWWASFAGATTLPSDAVVFVTDAGGTIVGIGHLEAAETFQLDLLGGFEGAVRLTFLTPAGEVLVIEAVVAAGVVYVDRVDLAALATEAGFDDVRVAAASGRVEAGSPPAAVGAPDARQEGAGGPPDPSPGPPDSPPGRSDSAPGPPDSPPGRSDSAPGPPDSPPGRPDSAPGRSDSAPGRSDSPPGSPPGRP